MRRFPLPTIRVLPLAAAAFALLSAATPARAATFTVTTTADLRDFDPTDGVCSVIRGPGPCTLRAAIQQANVGPGTDTIVLQKGFVYTLTLRGADESNSATGDLDINSNVQIKVTEGGLATIQGGSNWDDFVITVGGGSDVELEGVIVRRGRGGVRNLETLTLVECVIEENTVEGGIVNQGDLTLLGSVVRDNVSDREGGGILNFDTLALVSSHVIRNHAHDGGGIANAFTLSLSDSVITDNSADQDGGGILSTLGDPNLTPNAEIFASLIELNTARYGGGIYHDRGSMSLELTNVENNAAEVGGGGLYTEDGDLDGIVSILQSTFRGNEASSGGAMVSAFGARLELERVSVLDNVASSSGGGLVNRESVAIIAESTFARNSAGANGGGIVNDGLRASLEVHDSTLSGNRASVNGGGVVNAGLLLSRNVTIAFNTAGLARSGGAGGGIFSATATTTRSQLANTILASNRDASLLAPRTHDCDGSVESRGFNLIENAAGCTLTTDLTGNVLGVSAGLLPLASAGFTFAHPLSSTSPALDAGAPQSAPSPFGCPSTDQRRAPRPRDGNGDGVPRCDIGAIEM